MTIYATARVLLAATAAFGLGGCLSAGPAVIASGRAQYTEAITKTNDQQTLNAIVRMRYGETIGMLAVTSVTANISIKTNAQVQAGIGPDSSFAGNLVPLSGGVAYEDNPTITYSPVEGPEYLKQYLSPTPLEVVVLAARSARRPALVLSLLLERINGLWNPASAAARLGDSRFTRALELMELLRARGELEWGEFEKPETFAIVMLMPGGGSAEMKELVALLEVDTKEAETGRVVLPLRLSSLLTSRNGIDVSTRSVFDLLQLAASGVEVPEGDLKSGVALPAGQRMEAASPLRVQWSATRAEHAMVEVRHGDGWFYIDSTDHQSKLAFGIVQTLLTARTHNSISDGRLAPVLTIPVTK